jgi:hypothetical protein
MDRITAAPDARTRVVSAFSKVYGLMLHHAQVRAEVDAKARWAPQVARLTAALDQVERLRDKVIGYLHPKRREQVEQEFGIQVKDAEVSARLIVRGDVSMEAPVKPERSGAPSQPKIGE